LGLEPAKCGFVIVTSRTNYAMKVLNNSTFIILLSLL
jgi:hypothetical protein